MKILFFINALQHGGAARVLVTLSNELSSRGHCVYIMADTLFQKVNYTASNNVNIIPRFHQNHFNNLKPLRKIFNFYYIRNEIKKAKPDVIIGFMPRNYFLAKILSFGLTIPVIASERNDFRVNRDFHEYFIRNFIYPFAAAITFLSRRDVELLGNKLPHKTVMYNPLTFSIPTETTMRKKTVLAAGRLDGWYHKGFDNLINVWAQIAKNYPDWTLEIAGDGNDESFNFLKNLVSQLEIETQVIFLGFRNDMDILFQTSSIFVLSSRYEGMGQVLLEAMSQGCPCIAFEFDGRTREFITSSDVGIVVENQNMQDLEKSLIQLIDNKDLRNSIEERSKQESFRFSKDKVTDQWEALLNSVITSRK